MQLVENTVGLNTFGVKNRILVGVFFPLQQPIALGFFQR